MGVTDSPAFAHSQNDLVCITILVFTDFHILSEFKSISIQYDRKANIFDGFLYVMTVENPLFYKKWKTENMFR